MIHNTKILSGNMPRTLKLVIFDYDGTVVDDQSERQFRGLNNVRSYNKNEQHNRAIPHNIGLCFSFFRQCVRNPAIKVMILTARGEPASQRVYHTLHHHGVMIEKHNILFMNGGNKTHVLQRLKPCIYIDDQERHLLPVQGVCMLKVKL